MTLPIHYMDNIAFYEEAPTAPRDNVTYLLFHGLGNSLNIWTAVIPSLRAVDRVIAIDIPGFGRSPRPPHGFSLDHVAEQISDFLRALNIRNCILVAHSLGAFIALRAIAIDSTRFRRLILVDGTLGRALQLIKHPITIPSDPALDIYLTAQFIGGIVPLRRPLVQLLASSRILRKLALWPYVANPTSIDPAILANALANNGGIAVVQSLIQARHVDYGHLLSAVTQPVDLVWGGDDHLISRLDVQEAASLLDVQRKLEIRACAHWPMIEQPSVLADFILSWSNCAMRDVGG